MSLPSIIVILGPTSSGKSDFAVTLAQKLNGEIVSADSRQVYKGLDIGTGKITKKEMKGIPHYLLDVVSPEVVFSVEEYQKLAYEVIDNIIKRGKVPIICGGTGFYIQSIVDGFILPKVKINPLLREKLLKQTTENLYKILLKFDPKRAETIDKHNKVRLIRALEIISSRGTVAPLKKNPRYNALQIGIHYEDSLLKKRIENRLNKRIEQGMIQEAKELHENGLSFERMEQLGLEYRYLAYYLQNKISKEEMIKQLNTLIKHYAKRQMTWFKRDKRILWVEIKKNSRTVK